jgi:amino-transferase class IV
VFETLLVTAGRPIELGAHLERLRGSVRALFDRELPPGARGSVREEAAGWPLARLRLSVSPSAGRLVCETASEPVDPGLLFPDRAHGVALRTLLAEGGLGGHKWVDRSPLLAGANGAVPLLTEADGEALEAGWANLFAARDGALFTPPTDGRILPGVTRAAAIAIARGLGIDVEERHLGRHDLLAADEVFLTGSIRGLVPVRALDGIELAGRDQISRAVADGLRRRWRSRSGAAGAAALAGARPLGPPAG